VEASNAILFPNSARRVTVKNSYLEILVCSDLLWWLLGRVAKRRDFNRGLPLISNNHRGSARFSTVQNLSVGDLVAFKTPGAEPRDQLVTFNEPIVFQVGKSRTLRAAQSASARGALLMGTWRW